MREGKHPDELHLLQLANSINIKEKTALEIICEVKAATSKWKEFAKIAGVSSSTLKMIQSAINKVG